MYLCFEILFNLLLNFYHINSCLEYYGVFFYFRTPMKVSLSFVWRNDLWTYKSATSQIRNTLKRASFHPPQSTSLTRNESIFNIFNIGIIRNRVVAYLRVCRYHVLPQSSSRSRRLFLERVDKTPSPGVRVSTSPPIKDWWSCLPEKNLPSKPSTHRYIPVKREDTPFFLFRASADALTLPHLTNRRSSDEFAVVKNVIDLSFSVYYVQWS